MNPLVALVARRELGRIRERGYLISSGITILVIVAVALIPAFTGGGDKDYTVGVTGAQSRELATALRQYDGGGDVSVRATELADPGRARQDVLDGDLDAAVVDNRQVITEDEPDPELAAALQSAHALVAVGRSLAELGVEPDQAEQALTPQPLDQQFLDADAEEEDVQRGVAIVGVVVLFGQLIVYSNWVALGVVEEKSSRVVELLLATLRPVQLLAGKILGIGLLALAQLVLVVAAGLGTVLLTGSFTIPAQAYGTVVQVFGWFILAYAFYAAAYAAAGSLVSRQEEVSNVTGPMSIVLMGGYFAAFPAVQNPDSAFARTLSYLPPFSAMTMPARSADDSVAWWEIGLAVLLMVVATIALVWLSARIYSGAVLRTGARVRVGDALRAARQPVAP